MKEQLCKVLPWKNGLDILIWTCPFCGHQAWEYASDTDHNVRCTLCHRQIWAGSAGFQMETEE